MVGGGSAVVEGSTRAESNADDFGAQGGYPPGVTVLTQMRVPEHLYDEAIQEAWLAHLEGRNPSSAVTSLLRRKHRQSKQYRPVAPRRLNKVIDRRYSTS